MADEVKKPLFVDINPDDNEVTEIESLCLNCHEQGVTRLLLTKIPFFKEVILSSFNCEECGHNNREVKFAGSFQEQGVRITCEIKTVRDLSRQVVKSDYATFGIPNLQFEQPPSGKGDINTVEGMIDGVVRGLQQEQPVRKTLDPDTAEKIEEFIRKLENLKLVEEPFEIVVNDPSGNSYIENLCAPQKDPVISTERYTRNLQQDQLLGLATSDDEEAAEAEEEEKKDEEKQAADAGDDKDVDLTQEVLTFPGRCSNCLTPCDTHMKVVKIPFFKEVVIMATNCDACGLRDNEVKSGSAISEKGRRIKLHVTDSTDMARDVLKSDTCGLRIPELDIEMVHGTLGGKFTALEGLLSDIKDQLWQTNPFLAGDSSESSDRAKLNNLCDDLDKIAKGERLGVHIILDDPAGNSYLQNVYAPDPDPEMEVTEYERTLEDNELLGIDKLVEQEKAAST